MVRDFWVCKTNQLVLARQAQQRAQMLAERLKSLGVDPDSLV